MDAKDANLELVLSEMRQMIEMDSTPTTEAMGRWATALRAAREPTPGVWLSEPDFKAKTGRGDKWCRNSFGNFERVGLAKKHGKRRHWSGVAAIVSASSERS